MERFTLQQTLLSAMLPHVAFDGWSARALKMGQQDAGLRDADVLYAFPGGADEVLEFFMDRLDLAMKHGLELQPLATMKLHEKVRMAILLRLNAAEPYREAMRKAVAYYAVPFHAKQAISRLYRTTDCIWKSIGDHPTDFSHYTKRLSLAGIYSSTLLFWLDDHSEKMTDTAAFLDRRLRDLFRFHKAKTLAVRPFELFKRAAKFIPLPH